MFQQALSIDDYFAANLCKSLSFGYLESNTATILSYPAVKMTVGSTGLHLTLFTLD